MNIAKTVNNTKLLGTFQPGVYTVKYGSNTLTFEDGTQIETVEAVRGFGFSAIVTIWPDRTVSVRRSTI